MSSMLRKKQVFTIIVPIPGFVPRQLAIDILQSHSEVITLNPLVLAHKPIKAPRNAPSDEYYSTWYEIEQRIQYIPGLGKMGSGKITFNGCFHDMPWGLQTHIYAPMNVDLMNRYRIAGNQPGVEPPETQELGLSSLGAPSDGLYLRDDIEIKCNYAVASFVKSQMKAASNEMVARIIRKAQLLDAGVLHAMIEDGKLKTINPNDRTNRLPPTPGQPSPTFADRPGAGSSPTPSLAHVYHMPRPTSHQHVNRYGSVSADVHWPIPHSGLPPPPPPATKHAVRAPAELPGQGRPPAPAPFEMPGDFSFPPPSPHPSQGQPSPTCPSDQESTHSAYVPPPPPPPQQAAGGGGGHWRPSHTSQGSDTPGPRHSPRLATHDEAPDQVPLVAARRALHSTPPLGGKSFAPAYNPADYAKVAKEQQHARWQSSYEHAQ